ncbi:maleylpyruvate isomerase N-terminal domain-containing protein [Nocardioides sp. NPDC051685]|uniref:maleylpyruvate isomerase N-terminal domain-containing protein n=1 Tax=Nocardioides sp. NPDC051685 TaxID=3364334 RepID=UPI0037958300
MLRDFADGRRWMVEGTKVFLDAVVGLDEGAFGESTGLPGWTRKHLVAHVAANADALGNLVHWAATGIHTPMYATSKERAAGIARGPGLTAAALREWLQRSAESLEQAMTQLSPVQWEHEVVTAQGRTVPSTEIPWLRAREVCVHTVDLGLDVTFADLPSGFNAALYEDIRTKRGMADPPAELADAPLDQVTAWLAGRPHLLERAPAIGPWL